MLELKTGLSLSHSDDIESNLFKIDSVAFTVVLYCFQTLMQF